MKPESRYSFRGVDLTGIRNSNEIRVIESMNEILDEFAGFKPNDIDIEDIYALAVGALPPRYMQFGTQVMTEPVSDDMVKDSVRRAVTKVRENPNH